MNRTIYIIAGTVSALLALAIGGCASTPEGLQLATASSIGKNLAPEQIIVSNVQRSATQVKWIAQTPSGTYSCTADDMVRRPYCVKR